MLCRESKGGEYGAAFLLVWEYSSANARALEHPPPHLEVGISLKRAGSPAT